MHNNDPTTLSPKLPNDRLSEEQVREKLRKERNVEHLYIYKKGRQVARFEGRKEVTEISISSDWVIRMKDATVYHNHVGSSSFSFEDIALVVANDAKEFIVCSPAFDYIVRRPVGGWRFTLQVKNDDIVLDAASADIFEECLTVADQQLSVDIAQGQLNDSEKEDFRMHYVWSTFFRLKDIYYKRTPNL